MQKQPNNIELVTITKKPTQIEDIITNQPWSNINQYINTDNVNNVLQTNYPIFFALHRPDIVTQLINIGAEVNIVGMNGQTPLFTVLFKGETDKNATDIAVANILLNKGADPTFMPSATAGRMNVIIVLETQQTSTNSPPAGLALLIARLKENRVLLEHYNRIKKMYAKNNGAATPTAGGRRRSKHRTPRRRSKRRLSRRR